MVMVNGQTLMFMVLNNLLLVFFLIITSFGGWNSILTTTGGINFKRRKLTAVNPNFISIDCGANEDYTDEESGIFYKSDRDFIDSGENHVTLHGLREDLPKQWKDARSFPQGRRNCYVLRPEKGRNNSYLIRASFFYGNYDAANKPPSFDLYLGVNFWATVSITNSTTWSYYEIFHVFSSDVEYLCLMNTGYGTPFISILELRLLDMSIYRSDMGTQYVRRARDIGTIPTVTSMARYKDDVYDRMWGFYSLPDSVPINTSQSMITQDNYKLPIQVLRTAARPVNGSDFLNYTSTWTSGDYSTSSQYCVYLHFAEIEDTAQNQLRQFTITLNGNTSGPYTLQYFKPLSISLQTSLIEGNLYLLFEATEKSDLPPIVNALEISEVLDFIVSPTNPSDVAAMVDIRKTYNIKKDDWQGDPCVPALYSWNGLSCSKTVNGTTPRIISLNLSSSSLAGQISLSLSNLQVLESLDLSNNELSGAIPEVLGQMQNLKFVNLSGNKLTGSIPQSLKHKSDKGSLSLSVEGNPDLCLTGPCEKRKKFLVPIVASAASLLALLILVSLLIVFCRLRKGRKGGEVIQEQKIESFKTKNRPFTYSEIVSISNNFQTVIGEGGFGKVYFGKLNDNTQVAVKLLSESSKQGHKQFQAEAQHLMIVYHKNLVSLVGYCDQGGNMALIYEYMPKGNLREQLSVNNSVVLNWKERLQIAIDAAQGLEYLHEGIKPPIVHRDMKTANILLTENMRAKIADFGLSKVFIAESGVTTDYHSSATAGTPGYLDPECFASGILNKKSDVYSFGIILFEIITGQPVFVKSPGRRSTHIVQWVNPMIEKGDIRAIVDPKLKDEFDVNAAWKTVEIAMSCAGTGTGGSERPEMSLVLTQLKECLAMEMTGLGINSSESDLSLLNHCDTVPIAR